MKWVLTQRKTGVLTLRVNKITIGKFFNHGPFRSALEGEIKDRQDYVALNATYLRELLLGAALICSPLAHTASLEEKWRDSCKTELSLVLSDSFYQLSAPNDMRAKGRLETNPDGRVRIRYDIQTRDATNGSRHPLLRGAEQFEDILNHFKGRFGGIIGDWQVKYGLPDNIDEFNRLTGPPHNFTPQHAASLTWTGKQAASRGFTKVSISDLDGTPGHYKRIKVYFDNPGIVPASQPERLDVRFNPTTYRVGYFPNGKGHAARQIAEGTLEKRGELSLYFYNGINPGGESQFGFSEKRHLTEILDYFKGRYKFLTSEIDTQVNPPALNEFNRLTGPTTQLDPLSAARSSLLANLLKSVGYEKIRILELEGTAGHYTSVKVRFDP